MTSGSYSDYGIDRVFTNKEKAEKYVSLSQDGRDSTTLEIFETDDDSEINKIKYMDIRYSIDDNLVKYDFKMGETNTLSQTEEGVRRTYYSSSSWRGHRNLWLRRVIKSSNIDEDVLQIKYKKVCEDVMSEIKSLLEIEGWNEKMITDWLRGDKINEFVPEFE